MLELLSSGAPVKTGTGKFTYLGETTGPTYTEVNDAMGFVGGTRFTGDSYLSLVEEDTGYTWLVAKGQIIYNIAHSAINDAGGFNGKVISLGGEEYFCRTVKMTTRGFTSADVNNGGSGSVTYTADSTFANSEFNNIFYQLAKLPGMSVEGIIYGTAAQFTQAQLGFNAGNGGALIGAESNAENYRIVTAAAWAQRLSRRITSPYHGWRPMMRKL